MNISEFDYILPNELIATEPNPNRSEARLLVLNKKENSIQKKKTQMFQFEIEMSAWQK